MGNPAEETFCRLDQIPKPSSNDTQLLPSIVTIWKSLSTLKITKRSAEEVGIAVERGGVGL